MTMKLTTLLAIALMMSGCGAAKQGGQGPTYTTIYVEPQIAHVTIGQEVTFTATVLDQNGDVIPNPVGIQWQPSQPSEINSACEATWVTTPTPGNDATATIQTTSAITDCEFDLVVWVPAGDQTPKQIYTLANIEVE
jgi:hypothetical protein